MTYEVSPIMSLHYSNVIFFCTLLVCVQVDAQLEDILNPDKVDLSVWRPRNVRVALLGNDEVDDEEPNIFICEEPPNPMLVYSNKLCNYRNVRYHEQIFKWVAGRGCLLYTPDFLYVGGRNPINLNTACVYGDLMAPCLEIEKADGTVGCFPFDPAFEEVTSLVRNATVTSAHGRWEKCYYEASDCCNHYMRTTSDLTILDSSECETTFDGWTCWHPAESDTVASAVCSEFAYSNTGPTCHHFSYKECYANGTWEVMTDYSTCSVTPRLLRRYYLYIGILAGSTVACFPAIFIFLFYKRLRVTRVALHRNLLIAIIIRNILVIITRSWVYVNELTSAEDTIMSSNGAWCRVLSVLERMAGSAVFVCMLVEGIYLHRLIVAVFKKQWSVKWLYGGGALIAIVPVTAWAIVMAIHNDHSCWMVYTIPHIQWILDVPRILILLINTVLFIDVFRVLLTKLRNSENSSQLSTAKATLFLMPLFGVQFIFTAFRPNTTNCIGEQAYYYVAYTVEGLQGFIVAMLFCYVNKEVQILIKATYKKTEIAFTSRIRGSVSGNYSGNHNDRRLTGSTNLPANQQHTDKCYTLKPKYVAEIISIQASERLAEILDPIYESIDAGISNDAYDYLGRSELDYDSGFIPNRNSKVDDYYGLTNVSSVSIGCRDWLKDTPSYRSTDNIEYSQPSMKTPDLHRKNNQCEPENEIEYVDIETKTKNTNEPEFNDKESQKAFGTEMRKSSIVGRENMLDEIMDYIENNGNDNIKLDPNALSPNRPADEKIIFVDE